MSHVVIDAFTDAAGNAYELREYATHASVAQTKANGIPWPLAHPPAMCNPMHVGERRYVMRRWAELKSYRARVRPAGSTGT